MSAEADHVEIPTRLLVHALIREDGTVSTDELYTVANALGMSDQQVRLCIKRLVTEGRFTHEGRGRKAELHATAETTRALAPNADFLRHAFQQEAGLAPWDGVWHLVAFAVPESARTVRDSLRETLVHLGGAPLQGGLYVCANTWEPYVEEAAHRLGAHGALTLLTTTDLRRGDIQDPAELARRLWPLQEISDRYHRLSRVAQPRLARLTGPTGLSPSELLTIAVELAAELTRAMERDPLLPPQLLPQPWPGAQARELIARCWAALHAREPGEARPVFFRLYADVTREAADRAARSGDRAAAARPSAGGQWHGLRDPHRDLLA
ncbi:PaaX family transcriptional regulator C-terminal domain-containing protein [Streptomyces sp. DSM 40750]|uniref:PaaX family transcriptional regulator C-terminal domain-containing protein n=1 Tax=Streptomyces sp. DSM 40750 TaxID=2801030 RepID=UPI00214AFAED|nr:PaaX family transcriptional regulator C-terminal domain-containing protein [Streptomyces sp. DSM 40750]UUU19295.1 transcriptional regulator [Streptomyces sp. DSM 40750]UUU27362.1 transcriptional regulator [Streptomyces sp. DSM 40750]